MAPHQLINDPQHAFVDAVHEGARLQLDSLQRLGDYALALRRQQLGELRAVCENAGFGGGTAWIGLGTRTLDECRHALEVAHAAHARWTALCERQWHLAHDRLQAAIDDLAAHLSAEAGATLRLALRANDLAADAAERLAEGGKAAVSEAVGEIASTFAAAGTKPPRKRKAA